MNEFDFFSHEKIHGRLHLVQECYLYPVHVFNIYVVTGDKKTGVFDAGLAATGALRRYIESHITSKKPMICYVTHQDLDHIGGAALFDEAYMNSRELPKLDWQLNVERRFGDLEVFCNGNKEVMDFCRSHYLHNEHVRFRDIDDGETIDLGGIRFEVIKMPGHSPGSLVYYNREENYVLGGDAFHHHNAFQRSRDPHEALEAIKRFIGMMNESTTIYSGHEKKPLGMETVGEIRAAWEEILEGKTRHDEKAGMPFAFVDPEELNYDVRLHKHGGAGILYDANILKK
jgi:glyoxylase-like metal-dependent hydrolase (beta-lactamase superfamily II)